jgi:RNA polymerase sigma-70 factor (ECF subfamily)
VPPQSAPLWDEEIRAAVRTLQAGAPSAALDAAFEVLFRRFYQPLHGFFANRPALREEADDLVQATLVRAFQRIRQYRPEEHAGFAAWLWTVAENVWKNAVRERTAQKRSLPGEAVELDAAGESPAGSPRAVPASTAPDPERAALDRERTRVLQDAIEGLPAGMRKVTELRLFQDLQYEEIARIQGVGTNSVRSQLFEARKRLKPVLDDYFQGVEF